jgi:hypothetical protein
MRAIRTLAILVAVTTAVLLADWLVGFRVSPRHGVYWAPPPNVSTVKNHGLQLSVTQVRRKGDEVTVEYTLYRVPSDDPLYFMRPWANLDAHFWDNSRRRLDDRREFVMFDRDAVSPVPPSVSERRKPYKGEVTFAAPAEAAYVSVGLNPHDLMTRKVPIPKR